MYRKSPAVKRAEEIYKIMHNGFRFVVTDRTGETILSKHRYEWQAQNNKRWGQKVMPTASLLEI